MKKLASFQDESKDVIKRLRSLYDYLLSSDNQDSVIREHFNTMYHLLLDAFQGIRTLGRRKKLKAATASETNMLFDLFDILMKGISDFIHKKWQKRSIIELFQYLLSVNNYIEYRERSFILFLQFLETLDENVDEMATKLLADTLSMDPYIDDYFQSTVVLVTKPPSVEVVLRKESNLNPYEHNKENLQRFLNIFLEYIKEHSGRSKVWFRIFVETFVPTCYPKVAAEIGLPYEEGTGFVDQCPPEVQRVWARLFVFWIGSEESSVREEIFRNESNIRVFLEVVRQTMLLQADSDEEVTSLLEVTKSWLTAKKGKVDSANGHTDLVFYNLFQTYCEALKVNVFPKDIETMKKRFKNILEIMKMISRQETNYINVSTKKKMTVALLDTVDLFFSKSNPIAEDIIDYRASLMDKHAYDNYIISFEDETIDNIYTQLALDVAGSLFSMWLHFNLPDMYLWNRIRLVTRKHRDNILLLICWSRYLRYISIMFHKYLFRTSESFLDQDRIEQLLLERPSNCLILDQERDFSFLPGAPEIWGKEFRPRFYYDSVSVVEQEVYTVETAANIFRNFYQLVAPDHEFESSISNLYVVSSLIHEIDLFKKIEKELPLDMVKAIEADHSLAFPLIDMFLPAIIEQCSSSKNNIKLSRQLAYAALLNLFLYNRVVPPSIDSLNTLYTLLCIGSEFKDLEIDKYLVRYGCTLYNYEFQGNIGVIDVFLRAAERLLANQNLEIPLKRCIFTFLGTVFSIPNQFRNIRLLNFIPFVTNYGVAKYKECVAIQDLIGSETERREIVALQVAKQQVDDILQLNDNELAEIGKHEGEWMKFFGKNFSSMFLDFEDIKNRIFTIGMSSLSKSFSVPSVDCMGISFLSSFALMELTARDSSEYSKYTLLLIRNTIKLFLDGIRSSSMAIVASVKEGFLAISERVLQIRGFDVKEILNTLINIVMEEIEMARQKVVAGGGNRASKIKPEEYRTEKASMLLEIIEAIVVEQPDLLTDRAVFENVFDICHRGFMHCNAPIWEIMCLNSDREEHKNNTLVKMVNRRAAGWRASGRPVPVIDGPLFTKFDADDDRGSRLFQRDAVSAKENVFTSFFLRYFSKKEIRSIFHKGGFNHLEKLEQSNGNITLDDLAPLVNQDMFPVDILGLLRIIKKYRKAKKFKQAVTTPLLYHLDLPLFDACESLFYSVLYYHNKYTLSGMYDMHDSHFNFDWEDVETSPGSQYKIHTIKTMLQSKKAERVEGAINYEDYSRVFLLNDTNILSFHLVPLERPVVRVITRNLYGKLVWDGHELGDDYFEREEEEPATKDDPTNEPANEPHKKMQVGRLSFVDYTWNAMQKISNLKEYSRKPGEPPMYSEEFNQSGVDMLNEMCDYINEMDDDIFGKWVPLENDEFKIASCQKMEEDIVNLVQSLGEYSEEDEYYVPKYEPTTDYHYQPRMCITGLGLLSDAFWKNYEEHVCHREGYLAKKQEYRDEFFQSPYSTTGLFPLRLSNKQRRDIDVFDKIPTRKIHKIGILYIGRGDRTQEDALSVDSPSALFLEFLESLGKPVVLSKHRGYRGGLSTRSSGNDGKDSLYYADHTCEVMYHVTPFIPKTNDKQQVKRKRHIGNDNVHIVWNEDVLDYTPLIKSQFNFCHLIIHPQPSGLFKLNVIRKEHVPAHGPAFDGMVLNSKSLGILIRQTALNYDHWISITNRSVEKILMQRWLGFAEFVSRYKNSEGIRDDTFFNLTTGKSLDATEGSIVATSSTPTTLPTTTAATGSAVTTASDAKPGT